MFGRSAKNVGLYCDIPHDIVMWTIEHEVIDMHGISGYACHSMRCSKYAEDSCSHYGIAPECKSLMKQAQKIAKDKLIRR